MITAQTVPIKTVYFAQLVTQDVQHALELLLTAYLALTPSFSIIISVSTLALLTQQ